MRNFSGPFGAKCGLDHLCILAILRVVVVVVVVCVCVCVCVCVLQLDAPPFAVQCKHFASSATAGQRQCGREITLGAAGQTDRPGPFLNGASPPPTPPL